MEIKIICVGKIKEKFYTEAVNEYKKRMSKYSKLNIIEVRDESADDENNDALILKCMQRESGGILKNISDNDYVIALCIEGKSCGSIDFSKLIERNYIARGNNLVFIIGGSYGLDISVKQRADYKLSFSEMTFPHQLMRVILCEQIYRAFKIYKNEKYHK